MGRREQCIAMVDALTVAGGIAGAAIDISVSVDIARVVEAALSIV